MNQTYGGLTYSPLPVRDSDPETSRVPALTDRSLQRRQVLVALDAFGNLTADQITEQLHFMLGVSTARNVVASRLSQLAHAGLVWRTDETRKSPAGVSVSVWAITPEGREAIG